MIQNQTVGARVGPILAYALDRRRPGHAAAAVVASNLPGPDAAAYASQLEAVAMRRPGIARPAWHISISFAPSERGWLDTREAEALAPRMMAELGAAGVPWVAIRHDEGLHIVAVAVTFRGGRIDMWRSHLRGVEAARRLDAEFGLAGANPGRDEVRPRLSRGELELAERRAAEGLGPPPKLILAAMINRAVAASDGTREDFERHLLGTGVRACWARAARGGRVVGGRYELLDTHGAMIAHMSGGAIGHAWAWPQLLQRLRARGLERERERGHGRIQGAEGGKEGSNLAGALRSAVAGGAGMDAPRPGRGTPATPPPGAGAAAPHDEPLGIGPDGWRVEGEVAARPDRAPAPGEGSDPRIVWERRREVLDAALAWAAGDRAGPHPANGSARRAGAAAPGRAIVASGEDVTLAALYLARGGATAEQVELLLEAGDARPEQLRVAREVWATLVARDPGSVAALPGPERPDPAAARGGGGRGGR